MIEPDDNIALDAGFEEEWVGIRTLDADEASRICTQADTSRTTTQKTLNMATYRRFMQSFSR
jgi:hypothetical protein